MGARIEAVATAWSRGGPFAHGGLRLSDEAARACLDRAGRRPEDVELLVNAGIYREKNVAEPALASIIQEDIGANLGHPPRPGRHGTFSFDVIDGACGFLSAARLVDGFVGVGTARLGMVVAGDADPSPRTSHHFPFAAGGGAVLLAHADGDEGFQRFEQKTFPELADLFESRLGFVPRGGGVLARRGRNVVDIRESLAFAERCVGCAAEVISAFLATLRMNARDVDLLLASQYPRPFARDLAGALGIATDRVPRVRPELAATHTAGPIAALDASIASGALARARTILFAAAGAGITVAAALYRKPSDAA